MVKLHVVNKGVDAEGVVVCLTLGNNQNGLAYSASNSNRMSGAVVVNREFKYINFVANG